jgi:hypothetical protein
VVSFTPLPLYSQRNFLRYPLDRRLGGPQSRSGRFGDEKNLSMQGIETGPSSSYPVAIPTDSIQAYFRSCLCLFPFLSFYLVLQLLILLFSPTICCSVYRSDCCSGDLYSGCTVLLAVLLRVFLSPSKIMLGQYLQINGCLFKFVSMRHS